MPGSALPRVTRLFLAGNAVAMTGNGLVIAFTLIYLHQARGIALPVVGLGVRAQIGWQAPVGVVVGGREDLGVAADRGGRSIVQDGFCVCGYRLGM